jgi:hypothetical protein
MNKIIILILILFSFAYPAFADAIDGQWCFEEKNFSIDGSNFTTPAGKSITGEYDRHAFSYIVPDGEAGAGNKIDMTLIDEDTINLKRPTDDSGQSGMEMWKRCEVTS